MMILILTKPLQDELVKVSTVTATEWRCGQNTGQRYLPKTTTRSRLVNFDLKKIQDDDHVATTVIDVPLLNKRVPPIPTIKRVLWEIRHPDGTSRYVTIGNNGELWVVEGNMPNPDYAPSK